MNSVYTTRYFVSTLHSDCFGQCKPSALLRFAQDAAGEHCVLLGTDWNSMAKHRYFWAVVRQRMEITRLPKDGETVTVKTWPMPTTRVAYPRCVVAYDEAGQECFRALSLWVLMDMDTRAMVLPGRSGVTVEGLLRGGEPVNPTALTPCRPTDSRSRTVSFTDLDRNGHMNNTRYMEWVEDLFPSRFHREHKLKEFTVCYLAECREGQTLDMHYEIMEGSTVQVDAHRTENGEDHRVFSARMLYV